MFQSRAIDTSLHILHYYLMITHTSKGLFSLVVNGENIHSHSVTMTLMEHVKLVGAIFILYSTMC